MVAERSGHILGEDNCRAREFVQVASRHGFHFPVIFLMNAWACNLSSVAWAVGMHQSGYVYLELLMSL